MAFGEVSRELNDTVHVALFTGLSHKESCKEELNEIQEWDWSVAVLGPLVFLLGIVEELLDKVRLLLPPASS